MTSDLSADSGETALVAERAIAPASYGFPDDPDTLLPWSHARQRLERARNYWLATCSLAGRPHATPVWGVWTRGALYFDGLPGARWARNLAANPQVTIHLESGEDVVIIAGIAEDLVTDAELGAEIVGAWMKKYGRLAPEPVTSGLFRLLPTSARAWSTSDLSDGTRWRMRG